MGKYKVRAAVSTDAAALQRCMYAAYSRYEDRVDVSALPPMQADYREEIDGYPVWVIEHQGQVVAGLIMVFEEKDATLANIAVHPDFQGEGLGKALMDVAEEEARNRGYSELSLATHRLFSENVAYYRRQGWVQTGHNATKIWMKKDVE